MKWINDPQLKEYILEFYDGTCEYPQEHDDVLTDGWNEELMSNIERLLRFEWND